MILHKKVGLLFFQLKKLILLSSMISSNMLINFSCAGILNETLQENFFKNLQ